MVTRFFLKPPFLRGLPRKIKIFLAVSVDILLCFVATWVALCLVLGDLVEFHVAYLLPALTFTGLSFCIFVYFGLYQTIFHLIGWGYQKAMAEAALVYGFMAMFVYTVVGFEGIPKTVGIIQPIVFFVFVYFSRVITREILEPSYKAGTESSEKLNCLIYGAGVAGKQLAQSLRSERFTCLIGFLDDDCRLKDQTIDMLPVYPVDRLDWLVSVKKVDRIFLAIPSLSKTRRAKILTELSARGVELKVVPSVAELIDGRVQIRDVKHVVIEDLLGRSTVDLDFDLAGKKIKGKVVAVTGAGGSIGSELCKQILDMRPASLLLIDSSEYALYSIEEKLMSGCNGLVDNSRIIPLLCSVTNSTTVRKFFEDWAVDTVFHAAAYKHVPILEQNPIEAMRNNIFGTKVMAEASVDFKVSDFVLVSTDKAVRPTNVMGATKRASELVLQALDEKGSHKTKFSMVRFGNVLGSSGSVIPKFRRQMESGGPLTVTHPDVTRFFMTIPEAAQLVIQASALANGGEVFVLDMGEPVKISDLAKKMINLSGYSEKTPYNMNGDISIAYTGLRPGEKMYEELLISGELVDTSHPKIKCAREGLQTWPVLLRKLEALDKAIQETNSLKCLNILRTIVQEFQANNEQTEDVIPQRANLRASKKSS